MKGAACTGQSVRSEDCGDIAENECEDCFDKYDKCDKIPTHFCTDVRYASKMRRKQCRKIMTRVQNVKIQSHVIDLGAIFLDYF